MTENRRNISTFSGINVIDFERRHQDDRDVSNRPPLDQAREAFVLRKEMLSGNKSHRADDPNKCDESIACWNARCSSWGVIASDFHGSLSGTWRVP